MSSFHLDFKSFINKLSDICYRGLRYLSLHLLKLKLLHKSPEHYKQILFSLMISLLLNKFHFIDVKNLNVVTCDILNFIIQEVFRQNEIKLQ